MGGGVGLDKNGWRGGNAFYRRRRICQGGGAGPGYQKSVFGKCASVGVLVLEISMIRAPQGFAEHESQLFRKLDPPLNTEEREKLCAPPPVMCNNMCLCKSVHEARRTFCPLPLKKIYESQKMEEPDFFSCKVHILRRFIRFQNFQNEKIPKGR